MPDNTTNFNYPYPTSNDPFAPTADIRGLAEAVDTYQAGGYLFSERVTYTASDTWTKADYPGLRAVRVVCQGAGGAGGGSEAAGAGEASAGCGGGGGTRAEAWLLEAALGATESVVVGATTVGSLGVGGNAGNSSSFGATPLVRGKGGDGGAVAGASSGFVVVTTAANTNPDSNVGDLFGIGNAVSTAMRLSGIWAVSGAGGDTLFGAGGRAQSLNSGQQSGVTASGFGAGGGGAATGPSSLARTGGAGRSGVVIVDIYV